MSGETTSEDTITIADSPAPSDNRLSLQTAKVSASAISTEENDPLQIQPTYKIRPELSERFQSLTVKEVIDQTMRETLSGCKYASSQAEKWVKEIASITRERVNALDMKRYKLIVQVQLGEMRGAGIKSGMRCLWDSECDSFVSDMFQNDTLFCHTTVYGVYFY